MDRPLNLSWMEYCAHGESNGSIELFSEADRQAQEFLKSDEFKAMLQEAEEAGRREAAEMKARKN